MEQVHALDVRNDAGDDFAAVFQHPKDASLVTSEAAAERPVRPSADHRLINLNDLAGAAERIVAVERGHVSADLVAHAPRGFVGDAQFALDALRGNAVPRRCEQEHDVEPVAERSAGPVERRPAGRKHLKAAPFASVGPARLDAVELGEPTA